MGDSDDLGQDVVGEVQAPAQAHHRQVVPQRLGVVARVEVYLTKKLQILFIEGYYEFALHIVSCMVLGKLFLTTARPRLLIKTPVTT